MAGVLSKMKGWRLGLGSPVPTERFLQVVAAYSSGRYGCGLRTDGTVT